ncbi:MAG: DUF3794 domain-containing protein [Firmicutes bacterium]|nr:DUF3794 domain-containing protein [Bacillota bacterium]
MRYEEDGFDPTPYDRILGGIHTPAREEETETIQELKEFENEVQETSEIDSKECDYIEVQEDYEVERISQIDDKEVIAEDTGLIQEVPAPVSVMAEKLVYLDGEMLVSSLDYTEVTGRGPVRITVEEDILVPDIKPDMEKILSMEAVTRVAEREVKTGLSPKPDMVITGDIALKTIYIPEKEGKDPIITIQSRVPFKTETGMEIPPLSSVGIGTEIEKIEYSVINERKFRAKITLLLTLREYTRKSLDLFEGIKDEKVELLKEKITLIDNIQKKRDSVSINERLVLKEGMPEPDQILKYDLRTVENSKQVTGDKAVISGSIYYNILYLSRVEDEETGERISTPFMHQGKTDFTQFITLSSANGQSGAKVTFDDSDLTIKIRQPGAGTASEDDDYEEDFERDEREPKTPYFAMEGNLEVAIEVFRNVESEVATDMYCIDKELTFETEDFVSDAVEGTGSVEIQAREIVNVPDGTGDVDRVIFVSGKVRDCDSVSEYGKENVSGMIEAEMIVLPEDKKEKPVKLNFSLPFRGNIDIAGARSGMESFAYAVIRDIRCEKISGRQFELLLGISARGIVKSTSEKRLIRKPAFAVREESGEKKPGMILYVTKEGDSLWSVAKKFRTKVEKVVRVNGLDEEHTLESGRKLLIVK